MNHLVVSEDGFCRVGRLKYPLPQVSVLHLMPCISVLLHAVAEIGRPLPLDEVHDVHPKLMRIPPLSLAFLFLSFCCYG